jgi:hypothetical protein
LYVVGIDVNVTVVVAVTILNEAIESNAKGAAATKELEAEDSGPVAVEFVPLTLKVYEVPVVNPVTVIGEVAEVPVRDSGVLVAVKVVTAPPVAATVNATDAEVPVPGSLTAPMVGASGTSAIGVLPPLTLFNETLLVIVT